MPSVEFRCSIELDEGVVLSTQEDVSYAPIEWTLDNSTRMSVALTVPEEEMRQRWEANHDKERWWVVKKVCQLTVHATIPDVTEEDLARLEGRHPTAESFVEYVPGGNQTFQEASNLGSRVADDVCTAANAVLNHIRGTCGQYWVRGISDSHTPANLLYEINAEWKKYDEDWRPFCCAPQTINLGNMVLGATDRYLQVADWEEIAHRIQSKVDAPFQGVSLLADAAEKYWDGDHSLALIHLNAALEWAATEFVSDKLRAVIPDTSLKFVVGQSYAQLLENWVLPLVRQFCPDLEGAPWEQIQRIRKLRREAAHPQAGKGGPQLVDQKEFMNLLKTAALAVGTFTGERQPKTPPFYVGESGAGTV